MEPNVTFILADAATTGDGKLNILGGGWSITGPGPMPSAIGILIDVPWTETNRKHRVELVLHDSDGKAITPDGATEPVAMSLEFEVGRPPGLPPGTSITQAFAVNVPPLPLKPGGSYVWKLGFDGRWHDAWQRPFIVRNDNGGVQLAS